MAKVPEKSLQNAIKPHSCNQCQYSCTRADNLKEHMRKHSGEKPSSAINAATLALQLVASRHICWLIQEKSLSVVCYATTLAHKLVTSRHTCRPIQEWNLSNVTSATILLPSLVIWKYTSALTLVNNPTLAINAVSQASHLVTFRSIWWGSTESNQTFEKKTRNYCTWFDFFGI